VQAGPPGPSGAGHGSAAGRERYGRLCPEQVPGFPEAIGRRERYLPAMRGRGGISDAAMIAEIAAMRWAGQQGIAQSEGVLSAVEFPTPAGALGPLSIPVTVGTAELIVELEPWPLMMAGDCDALETGEGKPGFRWVQTGLQVCEHRAMTRASLSRA
jgi:hypothetical protein